MWQQILKEPVAIGMVIRSGVLLLGAFGFEITSGQLAAIMVFVEAVLALLTRASVTPNASIPDAIKVRG